MKFQWQLICHKIFRNKNNELYFGYRKTENSDI